MVIKEKPIEWDYVTVTVREYRTDWYPKTNINPLHQRLDVENSKRESRRSTEATKRQGIVLAMLRSIDIGEITLNEHSQEEYTAGKNGNYQYESIDGAHRKRSITEFLDNEFPLPSNSPWGYSKFGQLPEEIQQKFLSYKLRLIIFKQLQPKQKADVFQTRNKCTEINEQERLNGFGYTPIANLIRGTVRRYDELKHIPSHELFSLKQDINGKYLSNHISGDPKRLVYDRLVARFVYVIIMGDEKPSACDNLELEELYTNESITEEDIATCSKKLNILLNWLLECKVEMEKVLKPNIKIKTQQLITLWRLYYIYRERWGNYNKGWKILNCEKFIKKFLATMQKFDEDFIGDNTYANEILTDYSKKMMRFQAFNSNHRQFSGVKHWRDNIEWLEHEGFSPKTLIDEGIIQIRDTKRSLNQNERAKQLISQDFKDPITGEKLDLTNSHAGHKTPYSKGGKSDKDNIVMLSKENNLEQGTEDYDSYRNRKLRDKQKVSK